MDTLRDLRERAGLTQMALAIEVGAARPSQVSDWEAGRRPVGTQFVQPLARALGVSSDQVLEAIAATRPTPPRRPARGASGSTT